MIYNLNLPAPFNFQGHEYENAIVAFDLIFGEDDEHYVEKAIADTILLYLRENNFFEKNISEMTLSDVTPVWSIWVVIDPNCEKSMTRRFSLIEETFEITENKIEMLENSDSISLISTLFIVIGEETMNSDLEHPYDLYSLLLAKLCDIDESDLAELED